MALVYAQVSDREVLRDYHVLAAGLRDHRSAMLGDDDPGKLTMAARGVIGREQLARWSAGQGADGQGAHPEMDDV